MATSRRRSSGFTEKPKAELEADVVEDPLDEVATEVFETISQEEEEVTPVVEKVVATPPRQDPPPTPTPPNPPSEKAPSLAPRPVLPRRHPRNVPRFSPLSK